MDRQPERVGAQYDGLHLDRIGQPTEASVTPSSAKSAACPAAVPPPWLPIAATTNGSKPSPRTASTAAPAMGPIWAMPRLPAVIATDAPGARRVARRLPRMASSVAARTSATDGCW